ncbi:hypothetical protein EYF80_020021 [Liparis tanakae]|uniref:Uncharacterized protein n=1 Tax=Liparis tanakae TaxID=230148 RepID=A0A4Z2HVC4_9TELE|nr:hypothetical protein EYF80_020021 [Liparis tanakae]
MMAPPQRWEPATCRLTCHGQAPGEARWPPEALLEFTLLPQSEGNTAVREASLHRHGADRSTKDTEHELKDLIIIAQKGRLPRLNIPQRVFCRAVSVLSDRCDTDCAMESFPRAYTQACQPGKSLLRFLGSMACWMSRFTCPPTLSTVPSSTPFSLSCSLSSTRFATLLKF